MGELSCRIAHDSNNLLASVLGQAEIGLLSKDPSRMTAALEAILKSARELKTVNERLGRFIRGVEPIPRNTNLLEIFRELYSLLEPFFRKAGIEVRHAYGNGLPMTWCEPGGSTQVLLFGLRLALEVLVGAGGGVVTLAGSLEDGQLVFGVRFEPPPGRELDTVPASAGTLTFELAVSLAQEQFGSLCLDRAGRGWQLTSRFPIRRLPEGMPVDRAKPQSMPAAAEVAGRVSSLSVLVVDDEGPIRDLLQEVLEGAGCRVEAVGDGDLALRAFEGGHFDMVLTDIAMPGLDGLSLVRKLIGADPGSVVIVVTGGGTGEATSHALAAGATLVLSKPFELSEITGIIQKLRKDPSGRSLKTSASFESKVMVG